MAPLPKQDSSSYFTMTAIVCDGLTQRAHGKGFPLSFSSRSPCITMRFPSDFCQPKKKKCSSKKWQKSRRSFPDYKTDQQHVLSYFGKNFVSRSYRLVADLCKAGS